MLSLWYFQPSTITGDHSKYLVPGRTYGTPKNLCTSVFLLTTFGPIDYQVWSSVILYQVQ